MGRISLEDKLAKLEEEERSIKEKYYAEKKALNDKFKNSKVNIAKEKRCVQKKVAEADRKKRTKRLIETGAIFEKALGYGLDTPQERELLLQWLTQGRQKSDGTMVTYISIFQEYLEKTRH